MVTIFTPFFTDNPDIAPFCRLLQDRHILIADFGWRETIEGGVVGKPEALADRCYRRRVASVPMDD